MSFWERSHIVRCMTALDQLRTDIERFLTRTGMSPSRFGICAMNDAKFVSRLRDGSSVRLDTADRVRRFMAEYEADDRSAA